MEKSESLLMQVYDEINSWKLCAVLEAHSQKDTAERESRVKRSEGGKDAYINGTEKRHC